MAGVSEYCKSFLFISKIQYVMQGLISNLIRPFRFKYSIFDLGSKITDKYEREDSSVLNDRGFRIQFSYYRNKKTTDTCLVYAHCNSGSRVEGLQFVQSTMDQGWNLCIFDFAGSGISEGQYISLGYYQWIDLQAIISHVLKQNNTKINLWGRSMGAATIILYLAETKQIDNIVSCVLDSPYCSLWRVVKEFGKSKTKIPEFIVQHVMEYLRNSIFKDHRFDIKELDLLKKVHNIDIPIMFIASTSDSFVNCSHAAQLYKWAGSKQKVLEYIEKEHNSPRETNTICTGLAFMARSLSEKEQSRKELRILSKKKQLCRRMTGHNMAELIIKPIKNSSTSSAGNLGRLNSFCINNPIHKRNEENLTDPMETSPKQDKNKDKKPPNKNPHKIQQSIIKLALPAKQMLQHIKTKTLHEQKSKMNLTNPQSEMKKISELFERTTVLDKENNLNVSNKSRSRDESTGKLIQGIHNFNSIITKRFHFDDPDYHKNAKNIDIVSKSKDRDVKSKTQKINIYLKNPTIESPTKTNKFSGIKLVNKIKLKKEGRNAENGQKQTRKGKQRVKTQISHACRQSQSPQQKNKVRKQRISKNQLYSSYSQIQLEEKEPEQSKWVCAGNSLCKMVNLDSQTKEVYMNKYRDYQQDIDISNNKHENISCNQAWITRKEGFSPNPKPTEFKHFYSIGELSSSIQEQEGRDGAGMSSLAMGTQKIIKIQLDRNLFQAGNHKAQNKSNSMGIDEQKHHEQKQQRYSNPIDLKLNNPIIELNPSLSKFKLKQKKLLRFHQKETENNSFL